MRIHFIDSGLGYRSVQLAVYLIAIERKKKDRNENKKYEA